MGLTTYSESLKLLLQQLGAYRPRCPMSTLQTPAYEATKHTFQIEMPTALTRDLPIALNFATFAFITASLAIV